TIPEAPSARRAGIPLELDRIVLKCMQKEPALRYQHAEDLAADLKALQAATPSAGGSRQPRARARVVAAVALSAAAARLIGARAGWWRGRSDARTILVLPMEVRGQGEGADDAGRAFAEAVSVDLAQRQDLSILPVPQPHEFAARTSSELA